MQIQFDDQQPYQLKAIESVTRLFEGMRRRNRNSPAGYMNQEEVIGNVEEGYTLYESTLKDNLDAVQYDNQLPQNEDLDVEEGMVMDGAGNETWRYSSFTIEMETGTGKTYVYLRTIYELRKQYGFGKFIIIVPSIAIYQGVIKNFELTRNHFRAIYENEWVNLVPYDGDMSRVKHFATSVNCEVMLITLDSFNKISNILYKATDKLPGSKLLPYQYIQQTRPILILDEPQNMESETAKAAMRTLHPLFALRYSATHRSTPNQVYRLTPLEAFRMRLVKKIEVYGITENDNYQDSFVSLLAIEGAGRNLQAKVRTLGEGENGRTTREYTLRQGTDLHKLTRIPEHEGYVVENISGQQGAEFVQFSNEVVIHLNTTVGASRPAVFRAQIRETIQRHFQKQEQRLEQGIKVLSLFFIDRVANYTDPEHGLIRKIFDEEYTKLAAKHPYFSKFQAAEVRSAYFAQYKKSGKNKQEQAFVVENETASNEDERRALKAAFELIMQGKEKLLTLPENSKDPQTKVAFIFAHSALKEGWDNPNVFQICTLNHTLSERKKRQEIGRGLRLCVNQQGLRATEDGINTLTVIANESYETYVASLQKEYHEDDKYTSGQLPPKPSNAKRAAVKRNEAVFNEPDFKKFWEKLSTRLSYNIHINTAQLISECAAAFRGVLFPAPTLVLQKGSFVQTEFMISLKEFKADMVKLEITISSTNTPEKVFIQWFKEGSDLEKILKDRRLRGYKIRHLEPNAYDAYVEFANGCKVFKNHPHKLTSEAGQTIAEKTYTTRSEETYPVFNIIERAAAQTGLTRQTVNAIFSKLTPDQKLSVTKNPEGFTSKFIAVVKSALAAHLAANLEFTVSGTETCDLEGLFPQKPVFVQQELAEAGSNSIYNQVQVDSNVEKNFVESKLKEDENVVFYFKFPAKFRIPLPAIIGSYNPDWGIVRLDDTGQFRLQLVRETKGSLDKAALRFENEGLKVTCAERYFKKLGISYRQVTDTMPHWWKDEQPDRQGKVPE